jgi:antitoxin CcdA
MRDHGKALKRPVNLSLDSDLVRRARALTPNLSDTVETLLASFVDTETARRADVQRQLDTLIEASNGFIARHGAFGDEFSTL